MAGFVSQDEKNSFVADEIRKLSAQSSQQGASIKKQIVELRKNIQPGNRSFHQEYRAVFPECT